MRPLFDILVDEKALVDEIELLKSVLNMPESEYDARMVEERISELQARLIQTRNELRVYLDKL